MLVRRLLDLTMHGITEFNLVERGEPLVVALSGGKDSLSLCLALRQLGIDFTAVVVDMGYEVEWAERVYSRASSVGIEPEVVNVRSVVKRTGDQYVTLANNLAVLDRPQSSADTFTPCTYCYNAKVIALEEAACRLGASRIAFGHHQTDACASLLKEALMHIDRWDHGHDVYRRSNFEGLVASLHDEAAQYSTEDDPDTPLLCRIAALVQEGLVDTDEPPRQRLRDGSDIDIVRPMFFVDEALISAHVAHAKLHTEGSGCGHGATLNTQTPREMVHFRVLARVNPSAFGRYLTRLLRSCVTENGSARVKARRKRRQLLGDTYKPVAVGLDKL